MNPEYARSSAKLLVEIASSKRNSQEPVDDETWNELLAIGNWARLHALKPSLLTDAIPLPGSTRTWLIVEHAAQAILDSLNSGEEEGRNAPRN